MLISPVYSITQATQKKQKTISPLENHLKSPQTVSIISSPVKSKPQPKFGGFLNKLYNELIAEPLAGYRKIEDSKGELTSPAGSDTYVPDQDRKNSSYRNFNFHKAGLKNIDFSHSNFSHGTNFSKSVCQGVIFNNCDMPSVNFENSVLNGSDFVGAKLGGANFSNCDLETIPSNGNQQFWTNVEHKHGLNPYVIAAQASSDLGGKDKDYWLDSSFEDANLVGANFERADLRGTNFRNANLRHANFAKARMQDTDLTGAKLLGANFKDALLEGAKVNLMDVLEREVLSGQGVQAYINLGELLHTSSLKLNINNPQTATQIHELFEARDQKKITQSALEESFQVHYDQAIEDELPIPEVLPYVFNKVHKELL